MVAMSVLPALLDKRGKNQDYNLVHIQNQLLKRISYIRNIYTILLQTIKTNTNNTRIN